MSAYPVKLTLTEISHLVTLLDWNKRDGTHQVPKEQWEKRAKRIREKLQDSVWQKPNPEEAR